MKQGFFIISFERKQWRPLSQNTIPNLSKKKKKKGKRIRIRLRMSQNLYFVKYKREGI